VKILAHLQTDRWNAVHHRPIPEHRQVEAVAVEGDELRSQLTVSMKSRINSPSERSPIYTIHAVCSILAADRSLAWKGRKAEVEIESLIG
jgi:hypothetical protein